MLNIIIITFTDSFNFSEALSADTPEVSHSVDAFLTVATDRSTFCAHRLCLDGEAGNTNNGSSSISIRTAIHKDHQP